MTDFTATSPSNPLRSVGFWLAVFMGVLQATYAVQAFIDPSAFASYRGTPLAATGDSDWVRIYASRTLFIALVVGLLLVRRDLVALKWTALLGVVMPVTDALLANQAGAPLAVILRHIATVLYLVLTFVALAIWTKRNRTTLPPD